MGQQPTPGQPGQQPTGQPGQQQVSLEMMKEATEIVCEKCKNTTFKEVLKLRKIDKSKTGQEKDTLVPVPMFSCTKCGHINKEFDIDNM